MAGENEERVGGEGLAGKGCGIGVSDRECERGCGRGLGYGVTTGVNTARAMMGHLQRVGVLLGNDLVLWWELVGGKIGAKRLTGTECERGCARGFD